MEIKEELSESSVLPEETVAETVAETTAETPEFDDIAEREKEERERAEKIAADKLLPPDPDAILEVRHVKKH